MNVQLSLKDKLVKQVCKAAFPEYTGRRVQLVYADEISFDACWDGGTGKVVAIVNLADMTVVHPRPVSLDHGYVMYRVYPGQVIVAHEWFCGHDMGLTIYARRDGIQLLTPKIELTEVEVAVLRVTMAYKASYAGISDYRKAELRRLGYTSAQVDGARASLRAKKLLDARNALTRNGKDVASNL